MSRIRFNKPFAIPLMILALLTPTLAALPAAQATHCFRFGSPGSESCVPNCTDTSFWGVTAGFTNGGFLDGVVGQIRCAGWTIAGCTAQRSLTGGGACSSSFSTGTFGTPTCHLFVFDQLDGIAVSNPFAFCYDPENPAHLIPAVVVVVPFSDYLP